MTDKTKELKLWMPAKYRIQVQGWVDERYSDQIGGLTIKPAKRADQVQVTTLQGWLRDQAALIGVLNALINSIRLPLLAVEYLEDDLDVNENGDQPFPTRGDQ
jgi:hypothetical protein